MALRSRTMTAALTIRSGDETRPLDRLPAATGPEFGYAFGNRELTDAGDSPSSSFDF